MVDPLTPSVTGCTGGALESPLVTPAEGRRWTYSPGGSTDDYITWTGYRSILFEYPPFMYPLDHAEHDESEHLLLDEKVPLRRLVDACAPRKLCAKHSVHLSTRLLLPPTFPVPDPCGPVTSEPESRCDSGSGPRVPTL